MRHMNRITARLTACALGAIALGVVMPLSASAFPLDPTRIERKPEPKPEPTGRPLPVARRLLSLATLREPHHDHPAIDIDVRIGTPVHAIQPGRVRMVLHDGGCGNGIVVDGSDGFTYTYCHAWEVEVRQGGKLAAGDVIMASGISGSAENAHLHLEIEDASGRLVCPQPVLIAAWRGRAMSARAAPYGGCMD